jgi:hypothetical protein
MTEVESATKIRAKYLRALENEEWDLLPGPTYVKTFLRTYSEYLGLVARLMVEQYRQRFERPAQSDLTPFSTGLGGQRRRRRPRPALGPGIVLLLGVVLLVGALYVLGTWGQGGGSDDGAGRAAGAGKATGAGTGGRKHRKQRRHPTRVRLRIVPTGPVYVCLEDARGRAVIDKETLQAGAATRTFTGRRFRVTFGTSNVRMRVNGRNYAVPPSTNPIGYDLRPGRKPRRLASAHQPTCL